MHVAALHQSGLAWPCPAWLQPIGSGLHRHQPSPSHAQAVASCADQAQTDTAKNRSDTSLATSHCSDDEQTSTTTSSSSNPTSVVTTHLNSAADSAVAQQHTSATESSLKAVSISSSANSSTGISSEEEDTSSNSDSGIDSSSDSDNDSEHSSVKGDDRGREASRHSGKQTIFMKPSLQVPATPQQAAFDQLDALFAQKRASGSVSTHLAALDLLKRKPSHSVHSTTRQAGVESNRSQLSKSAGSRQGGKVNIRKGKQKALAGEAREKAAPQAEWLQIQNGGNPLYSNQKAGSVSTGEA